MLTCCSIALVLICNSSSYLRRFECIQVDHSEMSHEQEPLNRKSMMCVAPKIAGSSRCIIIFYSGDWRLSLICVPFRWAFGASSLESSAVIHVQRSSKEVSSKLGKMQALFRAENTIYAHLYFEQKGSIRRTVPSNVSSTLL